MGEVSPTLQVATMPAPSTTADGAETLIVPRDGPRRFRLGPGMWASLASLAVNALMVVVLGIWALPRVTAEIEGRLVASVGEEPIPRESLEIPLLTEKVVPEKVADVIAPSIEGVATVETLTPSLDSSASAMEIALPDFGIEAISNDSLFQEVRVGGSNLSDLFSSRSEVGRQVAVATRGGTDATEAAVERGLRWLAEHQMRDGSWSFEHRFGGDCEGRCSHAGNTPFVMATRGATGLALLPFLAAGYTHTEGRYREVVKSGLRYLVTHIQTTPHDGSFYERGGTMYSHGFAAIALCEAYAMTEDKALRRAAQRSLDFITWFQYDDGGFRYLAKSDVYQGPGDLSVTGWQLMALKSGSLGYLSVSRDTISNINKFLNSVQTNGGAEYEYVPKQDEPRISMTAVGLLCRMYLGWPHDEPALVRGAEILAAHGPSRNDLYFNYYATQVLFHFEGPMWDNWNRSLREQLIKSQATRGHESGSWYFENDPHNRQGGRLYCTALSVLMLEVYYRHLPLYGKRAADSF